MAAAGDGSNGEKSAFRCIDAVRYAVAAVVTVLIAAVVVEAIKVVFRRDTLILSVVGNSVVTSWSTPPPPPPGAALWFRFTLRAQNPSGRVRMYYTNITTYLFDNATLASTPNPGDDAIILFKLEDYAVEQLGFMEKIKAGNATRNPDIITLRFFDILYKTGGKISDVTMRVDGYLVTELRRNSTPSLTTYYCRELVVGDDQASKNAQEPACTPSP